VDFLKKHKEFAEEIEELKKKIKNLDHIRKESIVVYRDISEAD